MSSKIELKYRCSHCGKRNLYRTSHPDRPVRRCASCGRDFEVSPDIEVVPLATPAIPRPEEPKEVRRVKPDNWPLAKNKFLASIVLIVVFVICLIIPVILVVAFRPDNKNERLTKTIDAAAEPRTEEEKERDREQLIKRLNNDVATNRDTDAEFSRSQDAIRYVHQQCKFSVQWPKGWRIKDTGTNARVKATKILHNGKYDASIMVYADPPGKFTDIWTTDEKELFQRLYQGNEKHTLVDAGKTKLNGVNTIWLKSSLDDDLAGDKTMLSYHLIANGYWYKIICFTENDAAIFERYLPTFEAVATSFNSSVHDRPLDKKHRGEPSLN